MFGQIWPNINAIFDRYLSNIHVNAGHYLSNIIIMFGPNRPNTQILFNQNKPNISYIVRPLSTEQTTNPYVVDKNWLIMDQTHHNRLEVLPKDITY